MSHSQPAMQHAFLMIGKKKKNNWAICETTSTQQRVFFLFASRRVVLATITVICQMCAQLLRRCA